MNEEHTEKMRPLRTAAFVMLMIAAIDGIIDLIEKLAVADLWKVMAGTGLAVLLIDMVLDKKCAVGRMSHRIFDWVAAQVRSFIDWTAATAFGGGVVKKQDDDSKTEDSAQAAKDSDKQNPPTSEAAAS